MQINFKALANRLTKLASEHYDRAKKEFGVTTNWKEAGYILPDGTLLDLLGKNQGGEPGVRARDHREVGSVVGRGGTAGMREFMQDGAIRCGPESGSLDLTKKPTEAQYRRIAEFVQYFGGEVIISVQHGIGTFDERNEIYYNPSEQAFEFPSGTRPSKILATLRDFYK